MKGKVDFFIVGTARCGTTSLCKYLLQCDRVFIPPIKEPHYFGRDLELSYRTTGPEYDSLYAQAPTHACKGDASTHYLCSRTAAEEIAVYNPDARIIIGLRDPVERAYSHYLYRVKEHAESRRFEEAIEASIALVDERSAGPDREPYASMGLYADQVSRFLSAFGKERVLIHLFEDFQRDSAAVCGDVLSFIGVDAVSGTNVDRVYNRSLPITSPLLARFLGQQSAVRRCWRWTVPSSLRAKVAAIASKTNLDMRAEPPMNEETARRLKAFFREDIDRLAQLLGLDLSQWT
jgi:hypothetical protein